MFASRHSYLCYFRSIFALFAQDLIGAYFVPHVRDVIGVGSISTPGLGVIRSGCSEPDFNNAQNCRK